MPKDTIDKMNPRSKRESEADKIIIPFSESHGHLGRVQNTRLTWPRFCEKVSTPRTDNLTWKEYKALPISEQHKRKNQGYFVGGQFDKGIRRIGNIKERALLTFDIDRCSPETLAELLTPFDHYLAEYDYLIYSTRNHTAEAPRVRLVVPLAKPIEVTKYAPLQRIMAWHFDQTMETVDPISFKPSQIMYWPSVCKDAPYVHLRHRGKLLDGEAVLTAWGDWKNYHKLPVSPRADKARQAAEKATDPRTKHGVIGAFCRVYTVHDAIAAFLADVYVPGDEEDRYSYVDGSTANGAVVYDDGMFLYSHHGTDPCSGRLVNALDMVRIHKFGHLDKAEHLEADDVTSLPSYKEMIKLAQADSGVLEEMARDHLPDEEYIADFDAEDAPPDDLIAPARERAPAREADLEVTTEWMSKLEKDGNGLIKSILPNIRIILDNDDRLKGSLAYNEILERPVLLRRILSKRFKDATVSDKINGDELYEETTAAIRLMLETTPSNGGYGLRVQERDLRDAMLGAAHAARFHPVQRYLRSLEWDGIPRIRKLFTRYFRAEARSVYETFSYNFMVGAVQRAFEPGCKFDFVPMLVGPQGCGKSSGCSILGGPFFGELNANLDDRNKVVEQLLSRWIVEIPELSQFNKSEAETIKATVSAQEDRVRLAYGRGARTYKRRCVMVGTTNREIFLRDTTGNRRFWPVVLTGQMIDFRALARDRDQLWAEAFVEYGCLRLDHDGPNLPLHIGEEQAAEVKEMQAAHTEIDEHARLANQIEAWLDTEVTSKQAELGYRGHDIDEDEHGDATDEPKHIRTVTCLEDVAYHVFSRPEFDGRKEKALIRAMELVRGWKRGRQVRVPGLGRPHVWSRITPEL
jgi:putative DNA primase/helicase